MFGLQLRGNIKTVELYNFTCSANIFRLIKSRMMRWPGYVAFIGEARNTTFQLENMNG